MLSKRYQQKSSCNSIQDIHKSSTRRLSSLLFTHNSLHITRLCFPSFVAASYLQTQQPSQLSGHSNTSQISYNWNIRCWYVQSKMYWEPTDLIKYTQFFFPVGIFTSGTKCQLKFSQKFQVLWIFFTKATQLYCNGCAIPECKAQRLEGTSTPQQTCHPGILCYRSKGSKHCPGQNTRAPPGSPKIATWHICQEICQDTMVKSAQSCWCR